MAAEGEMKRKDHAVLIYRDGEWVHALCPRDPTGHRKCHDSCLELQVKRREDLPWREFTPKLRKVWKQCIVKGGGKPFILSCALYGWDRRIADEEA